MLSWFAMTANKKKNVKMSAYPPHPLNIPECQSSDNWSNPTQGNSWYDAIMSEIGNLRKFNVFEVIPISSLPSGKRLFSIVISFVTKRTKDSTPEKEVMDHDSILSSNLEEVSRRESVGRKMSRSSKDKDPDYFLGCAICLEGSLRSA